MARKQTGAAGASRERQVRQLFRDRGYVTFKSSDSAVADVIALRKALLHIPHAVEQPHFARGYLVEVKGNAGGPYMNFRAPERAALKAVADQAGLVPLLIHWAPNKPMRELTADQWPAVRDVAA